MILFLTAISCIGIRSSKVVQNVVATVKIGGLAAMILLVCFAGTRPIHFFEAGASASGHALAFSVTGFGVALVAILWAYEGWHLVSFVGSEMKKPQRDLPRSLFYGSLIVMTIYIVANVGTTTSSHRTKFEAAAQSPLSPSDGCSGLSRRRSSRCSSSCRFSAR